MRAIAHRRAAGADRNARRLLERVGAQRYGALIAFVVVAALLLAVSWLGLSLRAANGDRARLRDQRAATTRALSDARIRARVLTSERDRARKTATVARAGQVRAQRSARGWQARAQRQPAGARRAAARPKQSG